MVPEEIIRIFDECINPMLSKHNGYATPLKFRGDVLTIRMGGACAGCLQSDDTVNNLILKSLKENCIEYSVEKIVLDDGVDPEMWALAMKILKGEKIDE